MHKELIFQINSHSESDSEELVISRLGMQSIPYAVYLEGQVGAGKTFFCKQIARLYGIDSLASSSFLNYSIYCGSFKVVHVDYYYNKHPVEFFYNNIYDDIDEKTILLTEWSPNYFDLEIPQFFLKIDLLDTKRRKISFYSIG